VGGDVTEAGLGDEAHPIEASDSAGVDVATGARDGGSDNLLVPRADARSDAGTPGVFCATDAGSVHCAVSAEGCCVLDTKEKDYCYGPPSQPQLCGSQLGGKAATLVCDDTIDCSPGTICCADYDAGAIASSSCKTACTVTELVLCANTGECPATMTCKLIPALQFQGYHGCY
jgi:hypothetical protein